MAFCWLLHPPNVLQLHPRRRIRGDVRLGDMNAPKIIACGNMWTPAFLGHTIHDHVGAKALLLFLRHWCLCHQSDGVLPV